MEQRPQPDPPQLDRTYLPHPATTAEMYLHVILDVLVQIRDDRRDRARPVPPPPDGQVALREPAPARPRVEPVTVREQKRRR